ncbi:2-oxoacid:acceptor oxidoreductase subunit alpha, partial [Candidatus Woesearchaeota archaeon]|nr:2-oxoacid:acceptor oxidoreductase subunit alpha [Candidatus Woesearchaeota archaeon]
NIILGGTSGLHGTYKLGELLTKALSRHGLFLTTHEFYGSRISGSDVSYRISASNNSRRIPALEDIADLAVSFDYENYMRNKEFFDDDTIHIVNSDASDLQKEIGDSDYLIPINTLAEESGNRKGHNVVSLGAITYLLNLDRDVVENIVIEELGSGKKEKFREKNLSSFEKGYEYAEQNFTPFSVNDDFLNNPIKDKTVTLNGNTSVAVGGVMAGTKFFSGYQITPATSILETATLIGKDQENKISVSNPEDELAAIHEAIGASFAGNKAMTVTSGPGLALYTEGLGLAGMCELPVVVVDVQRGAPSTGLPTQTEQSDLNLALYGSSGDSPRIVLAPGSVEETLEYSIIGTNLAERYQCPVIILTDQFLSVSNQTFAFPLKEKFPIEERLKPTETELEKGYMRYKLTDSGISPVSIPGTRGGQYRTTGLEHDQLGFQVTEGGKNHEVMMAKRRLKLESLREEDRDILVKSDKSDNANIAVVSWGSTSPFMKRAVKLAREDGIDVSWYQPIVISHLPEDFYDELNQYDLVVVPELNDSGQLADYLIQKGVDKDKVRKLTKSDCIPFKIKEIYDEILNTKEEWRENRKKFEKIRTTEQQIQDLRPDKKASPTLGEIIQTADLSEPEIPKLVSSLDKEEFNPEDYLSLDRKEIVWCQGCGDFSVLTSMTRAFSELNIPPEKLVVVSGIGCAGRTSIYFNGYTLHGTHGRALPIARGIKTANPDLTVVAVGGDSDFYNIGAGHLPATARRNPDITAIVINNYRSALTKDQAAATSEIDQVSSITPTGGIKDPVNPIRYLIGSDVSYVAQGWSGNPKHLQDLITGAINHPGFSVINVETQCRRYDPDFIKNFKRRRILYLSGIGDDHHRKDKVIEYDSNSLSTAQKLANDLPLGDFSEGAAPTYLGVFYQDPTRTTEQKRRGALGPKLTLKKFLEKHI